MTGNEMVTSKLQDQIKYQEKHYNFATENYIRQLPTEKNTGISKDHTLKIRPHPGATSSDMLNI